MMLYSRNPYLRSTVYKNQQHPAKFAYIVRKCLHESGRDFTPEIIEKKRTQLKVRFYSLPREINEHEINMILKPLFKDVNLELAVIKRTVYIVVNNVLQPNMLDSETTNSVIDIVNDWGVHDDLRRFLIKSLTCANKNNIFRYKEGIVWKCPLSIHYVFDEDEDEGSDTLFV